MMLWSNNSISQTALEFDATDDCVETSNSLSLTSYTKEAWVKWDGVNGLVYGVLSGDASNPHLMWVIGSKMRGGHVPDEVAVTDGDNLVINEWTHFSITYDGATGLMQMYKNGVFVQQRFIDPDFVLSVVNIGKTDIGTGKSNPFSGSIDDVRIWDSVRTPEEIANNYESCLDGTEAGLVAFYDFEDGAGSGTLSDLTGNGNDGTLVNMDTDNAWVDGFGPCGEEPVEEECIEITSFYPNPTWNTVYLNLNASYNSMQVRIYNQWGYYCRGNYVCGPLDKVSANLYGLQGGRYYYVMVIDCETWKYDYVRVYKRSWC